MTVKFNYLKQHALQVPFLLEKAFKTLPEVEVISQGEADVVVNSMPWAGIEKGTKKTVYWELDIAETDNRGEYDNFDLVYFPSRMKEEIWPKTGRWLPMAVDTDYYHPIINSPDLFDVIFIGRTDRKYRTEYVQNLSQKCRVYLGKAERGLQTSMALSMARCSFQISEFENLEQRNFEYTAVLPMVLERVKDLDKIFAEDTHVKTFQRGDYAEFERQIEWCVTQPNEAQAMRDRAIEHLKKHHSYVNRAKQILEDIL